MENSELFHKFNKLFKKNPDNVTILEEVIDVNTQMTYFKNARSIKKHLDKAKAMSEKELLFSKDVSTEQKKDLLSQLASINEVEAFRTVEAYFKAPETDLREWSILAYQESKMLIESSLLDESPVFISTGLGGKKNKLRYFIVLMERENVPFTKFRKELIQSELDFTFKGKNVEVEDIRFINHVAMITALIPLDVAIQELLSEPIRHCNELGNFIDSFFIVTNVKRMSYEEVLQAIEKRRENPDALQDIHDE